MFCGVCQGLAASVQSCINNIRNTNSLMLMTVNRCIDFTKASKGLKLIPRYETIELMEVLQLPLNCMRNLQNRIEIRLQEVTCEVCSHIITDKQWLQENVLCLLSNAVKYSSEGFVTIAVSMAKREHVETQRNKIQEEQLEDISTSIIDISPMPSQNGNGKNLGLSINTNASQSIDDQGNQFLLFEIEDSGIGIPEEDIATLFNPFKQTQRLAGGTGLGLYSLAKRIEALKGYYGVNRRKDGQQGSLFWFMVPYRPDTLTAALATPGTTESLKSGNNEVSLTDTKEVGNCYKSETIPKFSLGLESTEKRSLKILIVDDSPSIVKMTSMMLRKLGHDIAAAENGEVAIKKIMKKWTTTEEIFDVILMDLQMPIMDGLEATRRLRKLEATVAPKFYSRNSNDEMKEKSLFQTLSFEALSVPLPKQIIVGMSANSDYETTEAAYKVGVDAFLSKPFNVSSFSEIATTLQAGKNSIEFETIPEVISK